MDDPEDREEELEERDYYRMNNVFWVPDAARWAKFQAQAKHADIGVRIDAALEAIEDENPQLKGILDNRFGWTQLEPGRLGGLIDLISTVGFGGGEKAKDVLGGVYEYFLGQFAVAEGRKGGQFYTPADLRTFFLATIKP